MKRFAFLCVGMILLTSMVGCCLHGQRCGGGGGGYGCGYGGGGCPGGACGSGVQGGGYPGTLTVPPQGAAIGGFNTVQATTPYGAPMAAAHPYPQTAGFSGTSVTPLETLPTY
jgi:hypothetical protein